MAKAGNEQFLSIDEARALEELANNIKQQEHDKMIIKLQEEINATPSYENDPIAHTQALQLSKLLPEDMLEELRKLDLNNKPLRERMLARLRALISSSKKK